MRENVYLELSMVFHPITKVNCKDKFCNMRLDRLNLLFFSGKKERNSTENNTETEKSNDDKLLAVIITVSIVGVIGLVIAVYVFYKYQVWQRIIRFCGGNTGDDNVRK